MTMHSELQAKHMERLAEQFVATALRNLAAAINCTPTDPVRDKLTEANIFAMQAEAKMKAQKALPGVT